jgi:cytoskeleton protein RodZ
MSEPAAPPGPRLKAEREHRGLSAQKAADEMHLDRWVIDALEAGDYKRIGPTVYAKGHLKKYAVLLGLPAAEILAGYESRPQTPAEPVSAGPSMLLTSRGDGPSANILSPAQILGCLAGAMLLLGVLLWRPWHQRGIAQPSSASAPVPAASSAAPPARSPDVATLASVSDLPAAADSVAPSAAAATAVQTPPGDAPPVPGAGRARLRLSFSADSWVDVQDASGHRTYAGNGLANSVKIISGTAPMRVYLGFGSGVQLEINDRAVAIGPQFFAGDVARFEAGADGVLRRDARTDATRAEQTHGAQPHNARPPG